MADTTDRPAGAKQDATTTTNTGPARNAEIDEGLSAHIDPPEGFKEVQEREGIRGATKSQPD